MLSKRKNIKSAKLVAKRRKRMIGTSLFYFLIVAGTWGAIFLMANSAIVNISTVRVEGLVTLSNEEVVEKINPILQGKYLFTLPKSNALFYQRENIENTLKKDFSQIRNVKVGLDGFRSLKVSIIERTPQSVWCESNVVSLVSVANLEVCYFVDETGLIYRKMDEHDIALSEGSYVKLFSYKNLSEPINSFYTNTDFYTDLFKFINNLKLSDFLVSSVTERGDLAFEVKLATGQKLIISQNDDLSKIFTNFQTVMSNTDFKDEGGFSKLDYIDLRFGNKIYYRGK